MERTTVFASRAGRLIVRGAAALCAALALSSLVAEASAPALAAQRVQRACAGTPRPGAAACTGVRLVPATLHNARTARTVVHLHPTVSDRSPEPGYLTPQALHEAYGLPSDSNAATTQTIALIEAYDDPTAEADLAVYDKQFGLPACTSANGCFRKLDEQGESSPLPAVVGEWSGETSIDVQMAHAICENCHVLLVEASSEEFSDLGAAVNTAVEAGATEINNSYAGPEEPAYAAYNTSDYDHPGVVITAAAGDCGYLDEACTLGEVANFPSDSPDVIAVGATKLTDVKGAWRSTVWSDGSSGCSTLFAAPPWQSTLSSFADTGCAGGRSVADVSAVGDPNTGVDIYDSTPEGNGDPTGWGVWGGTSVASPIVAAEFALAGGSHGVRFPAATLYSHLGQAGALYDVVAGRNGFCAGANSCQAAAGYDGPSGIGSPVGLGAFSTSPLNGPPTIASFTPGSGVTGNTVTIDGAALSATSSVLVGTLAARVETASATKIEAVVPSGARPGKITVKTPTGSVTSHSRFMPTLALTSFSPANGRHGRAVMLVGVGFTRSSAVRFNGVPATRVAYVSSRRLIAIAPHRAGTGPITVTNARAPAGTVSSAGSYSSS
jgi:hypothetical protein